MSHKDQEARRAYSRAYYHSHHEVVLEQKLQKRRARGILPRKARLPKQEKARNQHLRREYGIDQKQWLLIFEAQGEKCARCSTSDPGTGRRSQWHTEHDHQTGELRGIVCKNCNQILGRSGDSREGIIKSTEMSLKYLEEGPALVRKVLTNVA